MNEPEWTPTYRERVRRRILELAPTLKALDPSWPAPTLEDLGAYSDAGLEDLGRRIVARIDQARFAASAAQKD